MNIKKAKIIQGLSAKATPTSKGVNGPVVLGGKNETIHEYPDANLCYSFVVTATSYNSLGVFRFRFNNFYGNVIDTIGIGLDFEGVTLPAVRLLYGLRLRAGAENYLPVTINGNPVGAEPMGILLTLHPRMEVLLAYGEQGMPLGDLSLINFIFAASGDAVTVDVIGKFVESPPEG